MGSLLAPPSPSDQMGTGNQSSPAARNVYTQRPLLSNGMSNGFVRCCAFSWNSRRNATRGIRLRGSNLQKQGRPAPSPPDQPGLPEWDLENESAWRSAPAEVPKQNAFGSLDRGNYRRSQTAVFSDRLGGHHGDSVREVTVDGYWVSVTLFSRD
jgi:hypothetical protein